MNPLLCQAGNEKNDFNTVKTAAHHNQAAYNVSARFGAAEHGTAPKAA
jgi:hypothetical protein